MKTSDWRLDERMEGVFVRVTGPGRAGVAPAVEEAEAEEEGLPVTDRRPDCGRKESGALGDNGGIAGSLMRPVLCRAGSFALIASAKARDMVSDSGVGRPGC
jgi:hypothetical protein